MFDKITTIDEFIKEIGCLSSEFERTIDCKMVVYRGEQEVYQTSGIPNLFRGDTYMKLLKSPIYEKNVIDEVIMNRLSHHHTYLQAAMDAQHGGFPSRLLDITFNSLIALFFATTPHFTEPIDSNDASDGVVIVYAVDKMYSSNSSIIQDYFEKVINPKDILNSSRIIGYAHKFIDHSNINLRIKSQHGGFILFSGNQFIPIPEWRQKKIIIDKNSKKKIREDLQQFFGLTMASVYPEADNFVGYLTEKAEILVENTDDQNLEIYYELEKYLLYYKKILIKMCYEKKSNILILKKILEIELYLTSFMKSVTDSIEIFENLKKNGEYENLNEYYKLIASFLDEIASIIPKDLRIMSINDVKKLGGIYNEGPAS